MKKISSLATICRPETDNETVLSSSDYFRISQVPLFASTTRRIRKMKQFNRREFIQLTATAIGGIMLTGCGSSGGGSSVPNGYRFYRLMGNGATVDPMGASFPIERFYGSAHISANGIITFDAMNVNKRRGLFQLGVDTDGFSPKILWERSALLVGDSLDDGRVVGTFKSYDVDQRGNIAAMIDADVRHHEEHYGTGLYVEYEQQGFAPLLIAGQEMT
jgi:hypothetical protein